MQTWNGNEAGPIQVSKFKRAWSRLNTAYCSYRNGSGMVVCVFNLAKTTNPQELEAQAQENRIKEAIGARFGWTLTRKNAKEVLAALEAEYSARMAALPQRVGVGA